MGLLRFSLAVCVLFTHLHNISILGMRWGDGKLAVQCFYMISGFYMALVLNEKYLGKGSYRLFIEQRYLRLFPTYFIILLFTLLVEIIVRAQGIGPNWGLDFWIKYSHGFAPFTWVALAFSNLTLIGLDITSMFTAVDPQSGQLFFEQNPKLVPLPSYDFTVVGPAWTIGLEISFYIVAPFLVRKPVIFQLLVILLSYGLRFFGAYCYGMSGESWSYRFILFEMGIFMLGSVAYRVYRDQQDLLHRCLPVLRWIRWPFFIALAFYTRLPFGGDTRYYIFAIAIWFLLPYLFQITKDLAWDRLLGELSYPMYLIHWSVILIIGPWIYHVRHNIAGIVYVGIVVALSWLIYRFIENPMDRFRHRLYVRQKQRLDSPAAG